MPEFAENSGSESYIDYAKLPVRNSHANCGSCAVASACCRKGIAAPFTRKEARQIIEAGTELRQIERSELSHRKPGRGKEFYEFLSDCANLDAAGKCSIYEYRPEICRQFAEGGLTCQLLHILGEKPLPPQWEISS